MELKGKSDNGIRWDASYSFTRVTDSQYTLEEIDYQGSAPQHHVRLGLGYTIGPWELDGNVQGVTGTDMLRSNDGGIDETIMPAGGYVSVAGRVGYKITETVTAALSGTDLTRQVVSQSPYPAVERQIFLNLTARF